MLTQPGTHFNYGDFSKPSIRVFSQPNLKKKNSLYTMSLSPSQCQELIDYFKKYWKGYQNAFCLKYGYDYNQSTMNPNLSRFLHRKIDYDIGVLTAMARFYEANGDTVPSFIRQFASENSPPAPKQQSLPPSASSLSQSKLSNDGDSEEEQEQQQEQKQPSNQAPPSPVAIGKSSSPSTPVLANNSKAVPTTSSSPTTSAGSSFLSFIAKQVNNKVNSNQWSYSVKNNNPNGVGLSTLTMSKPSKQLQYLLPQEIISIDSSVQPIMSGQATVLKATYDFLGVAKVPVALKIFKKNESLEEQKSACQVEIANLEYVLRDFSLLHETPLCC